MAEQSPEKPEFEPPELTSQIVEQLTASLGDFTPEGRYRIAREVPGAARQAFHAEPRRRPAIILRDLRKLQKDLRRGDAIPEVRDDLWPTLGVSEEEIENVLVSPKVLADIVESAIQHFGTSPETVHDRKGGRRRDSRIDRFAYYLARIYQKHLKQRPTFTQDPEKGWAVSPFALFAIESFALFCPLASVGEGQIREALRAAVEMERDVKFLSAEELE